MTGYFVDLYVNACRDRKAPDRGSDSHPGFFLLRYESTGQTHREVGTESRGSFMESRVAFL